MNGSEQSGKDASLWALTCQRLTDEEAAGLEEFCRNYVKYTAVYKEE